MKKPLCFVVYHTQLPEESVKTILEYTPSLKQNENEWRKALPQYNVYLKLLFTSARRFHPDCKLVVLTDASTPFDLPKDIEIKRLDVDAARPAYMRFLAQIDYLKHADEEHHVLFMDYDMIIQDDLSGIFDHFFDIAFTYRNHKKREHPFNGGLIIVPNNRLKQGQLFLERVKAIYDKNYTDKFQIWGGLQRSLRDTVGPENFFSRQSDVLIIDGIKILLLDADVYNFSTETDDMSGSYPDKKILHYKGNRKQYMKG
jgi:hypothetical protein